MFLSCSLVKIQYCGLPPWPKSSELGLRPRISNPVFGGQCHLIHFSLYGLKPHSFHFRLPLLFCTEWSPSTHRTITTQWPTVINRDFTDTLANRLAKRPQIRHNLVIGHLIFSDSSIPPCKAKNSNCCQYASTRWQKRILQLKDKQQ